MSKSYLCQVPKSLLEANLRDLSLFVRSLRLYGMRGPYDGINLCLYLAAWSITKLSMLSLLTALFVSEKIKLLLC